MAEANAMKFGRSRFPILCSFRSQQRTARSSGAFARHIVVAQNIEPFIMIDSVTVGTHVLHTVEASVTPDGSEYLLGMSLRNQIGPFKVDTAGLKLTFG
jgi:hypothetical protein